MKMHTKTPPPTPKRKRLGEQKRSFGGVGFSTALHTTENRYNMRLHIKLV
jgi:hypothetical protein